MIQAELAEDVTKEIFEDRGKYPLKMTLIMKRGLTVYVCSFAGRVLLTWIPILNKYLYLSRDQLRDRKGSHFTGEKDD